MKNISRKMSLQSSSLIKTRVQKSRDSSSEERSETGLETKRSTMHSEVHPKRGELQSAEG